MSKLTWGILGAGAIAKAFARAVATTKTSTLLAVASREQAKADAFGNEFSVPKRYGSYEALLADPEVRAVYICTPHPGHAVWAIKAANAGKHLLVEKPIAVNHAQAMAIAEAAELNNVFLMEAFMYRCHPQTQRLVDLIKDRAIGDVRLIQATFSFHAGFNPDSRLFKNELAGGGILDVGCYAASMARLIAGAAVGKPFENPSTVTGAGHVGTTGVDEWATASLKFPGTTPDAPPIIAQIATGVSLNQENVVRVFGSEGWIYVPNPWVASREGGTTAKIVVHRKGQKEPQEVHVDTDVTSFALEADVVAACVMAGKRTAASPAMSVDDSLGNIATLDKWRAAIGQQYEMETPKAYPSVTVKGLPLKKPDRLPMRYGTIKHLDKPVSRLIMGCDNAPNLPHAAVMYDDWFEKGGNTFDTAHIYGGGNHERLLGQWMKLRGVRDQCVVIVKGAHSPQCDPVNLKLQFKISLERLQTDAADIYIMHRDNPDVPVGEFVGAMNDLVKAGQVRAFGGSNWTLARVQEANDYAAKHGLQGFSVVSNNFSLARMVNPPWAGCIAASDPDSRAWFKDKQLALLSWSSQARGFFLPDRAGPDKLADKELVRCWYSDDNFQRQARAIELAALHKVDPINIAAAYVLHQPFPTFALIGPRTLKETRTSLPALDVQLSEQEVKYLNLEA
jgi:predicted dehydrogenase/aryl-alcohol dehydrogenase-like predicted oxidoreductase